MTHKSTIVYLPFSVSIQDMQKQLNQNLPDGTILYDDDEFAPVPREVLMVLLLKHKVQVIKAGEIQLKASARNTVTASIPLQLRLSIRYGIENNILSEWQTIETTGDITLFTRSSFTVGENWQLQAKPKIERYEWGDRLKMRIMGFSVNMNWLKERTVINLLPKLLPKIDEKLVSEIDLKEELTEAWQYMREAIPLNENPPFWLKIVPKSLQVAAVEINEDRFVVKSRIKGKTSIHIGDAPEMPELIDLPELELVEIDKKKSVVRMLLTVDYTTATRLLKKEMAGKTFDLGARNMHIKVEDLSIEHYKDGLVKVNLKASGSTKGDATVIGRPAYSESESVLFIDQVDFTLKSSDLFLSLTSRMLPNVISRLIQRNLRLPVKRHIKKIVNYLDEAVSEQVLTEDILLKGKVGSGIIEEVVVDANGIHLYVKVKGEVGIGYNYEL